jgi:hypothetical protein
MLIIATFWLVVSSKNFNNSASGYSGSNIDCPLTITKEEAFKD